MPNYGDPSYWEERYKNQKESLFDWLEDYETLKSILEEFKLDKKLSNAVILGCGNAEFSEKMYDDGYEKIFNVDISDNVIKVMSERNKVRDKMQCNNCIKKL